MRYWVLLLSAVVFSSTGSEAGGKKKPPASTPPAAVPSSGKKVIGLAPVERIKIQMPDESWHNFGNDFEQVLGQKLIDSGRYVIADADSKDVSAQALQIQGLPEDFPDSVWPSSYTPAATVRISVNAMSFITGARGDQMFYGFDQRFRTPFNDGSEKNHANEFPLKSVSFEPNWFDRQFDAKGLLDEFDSQVGLDLGQGFQLNALFAWLNVKYAKYQSYLNLEIDIDAPLSGKDRVRHQVAVSGKGHFYDIAGAYQGYSLGIRFARTDAMLQALKKAIEATHVVLDNSMKDLPLTGKIDGIKFKEGVFYLGTGRNAEVPVGTIYEVVDAPDVLLQVVQSARSGSVAKILRGDISTVKLGMFVRQPLPGQSQVVKRALAGLSIPDAGAWVGETQNHSIELPWTDLEKAKFKEGDIPKDSKLLAIWKSITQTVLLAYRVYRYFQYDRAYHERADLNRGPQSDPIREGWGRQIGLDQVGVMPELGDRSPIVAVVGSGVDYNHPAIHSSLWLNPGAQTDTRGERDRYGWDFISGDDHPMDDAYPGTQAASLVLSVAPQTRIMAVKAINPWGITSSAALYASFVYAVDHGAKVILCPWATRVKSVALEMASKYAQEHGVLVVAGAGDRGDALSSVGAYPAAYSAKNDHVLSVTSVDDQDHVVEEYGRYANYDPALVQIAAPGQDMRVAEPRGHWRKSTSTGLAAAVVAGAIARLVAEQPDQAMLVIKQQLLNEADRVPNLSGKVQEMRRLRMR